MNHLEIPLMGRFYQKYQFPLSKDRNLLFVVQAAGDLGDRYYCHAVLLEGDQAHLVTFVQSKQVDDYQVLFGVPNVIKHGNRFYLVTGKEDALEDGVYCSISRFGVGEGGQLILDGTCRKPERELLIEQRRGNRVFRKVNVNALVF